MANSPRADKVIKCLDIYVKINNGIKGGWRVWIKKDLRIITNNSINIAL